MINKGHILTSLISEEATKKAMLQIATNHQWWSLPNLNSCKSLLICCNETALHTLLLRVGLCIKKNNYVTQAEIP